VLEEEGGGLRFLVHPELRAVVGSDSKYIEPLLQEFPERAKDRPADLFRQLSTLGVGLLVTHETGRDLANHPSIEAVFSKFVPLVAASAPLKTGLDQAEGKSEDLSCR
jgi:hypothetical protein